MTSIQTMNFLFYVGVIVPTIITIILFLVFMVCLKRIKARREVLYKRHDPHGRMRELGLPMVPPPPPKFEEPAPQINVDGADNTGYQVSRSPSTETESATTPRGTRPMYNSCPDSGMSGLSEVTTCKDRPRSQASHSSTDSEDSGFRSSRSGNFPPSANQTHDVPLLKPIRSNRDSVLSQSVRFSKSERTPTKNISHDDLSLNTPTCSISNQKNPINVNDIKVSSHLSWQYLQNLSARNQSGQQRPPQPLPGQQQQQTFTMAQIHQSVPKIHEHPESDFGFSVV